MKWKYGSAKRVVPSNINYTLSVHKGNCLILRKQTQIVIICLLEVGDNLPYVNMGNLPCITLVNLCSKYVFSVSIFWCQRCCKYWIIRKYHVEYSMYQCLCGCVWVTVCVPVTYGVCMGVWVSVCMSVTYGVWMCVWVGMCVCLSVCQSHMVCAWVDMCVCLYVCQSLMVCVSAARFNR
jgi:hypothetical protein